MIIVAATRRSIQRCQEQKKEVCYTTCGIKDNKDDVFTYLIHLGYLSYDADTEQCYIPNEEIRKQWVISVRQEEDYAPVMEMIDASRQLLEDTIEGDAQTVADALTKAHNRATNPLTYNRESSFQSAIGLAYFFANTKYTVRRSCLPARAMPIWCSSPTSPTSRLS